MWGRELTIAGPKGFPEPGKTRSAGQNTRGEITTQNRREDTSEFSSA